MKVSRQASFPTLLTFQELVVGEVYEYSDSFSTMLMLMTDENSVVDLADGTLYGEHDFPREEDKFRLVEVELLVKS